MTHCRKFFLVCALVASVFAGGENTIAVLDLRSTTIEENLLVPLTNRLCAEVVKTNAFTVVERTEMDAILKEQGFQQTGCTDASCAIEAGHLLNVNYIVLGTFDKLGNIYSINVRMVSVATGEIIKNISDDCVDCSMDDFVLKTVRRAALKLVGQDAANIADEKVSGALAVQHFLYKGAREGELGSIAFDVSPLESQIMFDDSAYGTGKVFIENVPEGRHRFEIMPHNEKFMPLYGVNKIFPNEIKQVQKRLRKFRVNLGFFYSMAYFYGRFTIPPNSYRIRYDSDLVSIPVEITSTAPLPANPFGLQASIETRKSHFGFKAYIPMKKDAVAKGWRNEKRTATITFTNPRHAQQDIQLHYDWGINHVYGGYLSYYRKLFFLRDYLVLRAGADLGLRMAWSSIQFSDEINETWDNLDPIFDLDSTEIPLFQQMDFGALGAGIVIGSPGVRFSLEYQLGMGMVHHAHDYINGWVNYSEHFGVSHSIDAALFVRF